MSVINYCRRMGFEDHNIVVDVVMSTNPELPRVSADHFNGYGMITRSVEILKHNIEGYGVLRAIKNHPDVHMRHIIGPSRSMAYKIVPIEFTDEEVSGLIRLGEQDAEKAYKTDPMVDLMDDPEYPMVGTSRENHSMRGMTCVKSKRYWNQEKDKAYRQYCGFE